jgi:hypothetical protein
MWGIFNSKKREKTEIKEYLSKVRYLERKAFEHLSVDQNQDALNLFSQILDIPMPITLHPDDLEFKALSHKFSRIRFKIDLLKSKQKKSF